MKRYSLILVHKPTFTKEQVEEKINKEIFEIFHNFGIKNVSYTFCGQKLFTYIIKKFKSGHYYTLNFSADEKTANNINKIQKRIKENQDILRAITLVNYDDNITGTLSKIEANINAQDLYI